MEAKKRSWGRHYLPSVCHASRARDQLLCQNSMLTALNPFFSWKKTTKLGNQPLIITKKKMATFSLQNLMISALLCALWARSSACKARNKVFAKIQAAISLGAFKLPSSCKNLIWCIVINILSDSSNFIVLTSFDTAKPEHLCDSQII